MTFPKFKFKPLLALLFVSAALLTSCKDNGQATEAEANTPQEATLEQKKQALESVAPSSSNNAATGDVAMNPPHGQPGHSCKIPVGAPLNGSGAKNSTPIKTNSNAAPASGSGINPPHGQPGHRCDVKVGDPL
ncbi:hypothetical protein [Aequorivita marina]|uniref:hypothetical protein n=1 Tax=Aequorivita marina TaxID=3073654 RepID=UPI0028748D50|nr:hypothetical protein [Aequorivita sp. S2608]MDS1297443.1 hypothetical protein [Aequorivita sp. S2608]